MKFSSVKGVVYSGVYSSFCAAHSNIISVGFNSLQWIQRQRDFLDMAILDRSCIRIRPENLSALINLLNGKQLKIIDFGGGSGWLFFALPEQAISKIDRYFVFENKELILDVCSHIRAQEDIYASVKDRLDYELSSNFNQNWVLENLDESTTNILYMNSVIQYLPNLDIFNYLPSSIDFVLIEDVTEHSTLSFWTRQRYYDTWIPRKIFRRNELIVELEKYGFLLSRKIQYAKWVEKRYVYQNNSKKYILRNPRSYIFKRQVFSGGRSA
jgi:putative methyltransferase (TIGR04325 family)